MVQISNNRGQSFYDKQMLAISSFFESERQKNEHLDFETAFTMWLTNGYAEKFRKLHMVAQSQYN